MADLVTVRYFIGFTFEAAEVLGLAVPAAKQWWAYAQAWLRVEIAGAEWAPTLLSAYARSSPRIVPVEEANLSVSRPRRWSMETKRFGSG